MRSSASWLHVVWRHLRVDGRWFCLTDARATTVGPPQCAWAGVRRYAASTSDSGTSAWQATSTRVVVARVLLLLHKDCAPFLSLAGLRCSTLTLHVIQLCRKKSALLILLSWSHCDRRSARCGRAANAHAACWWVRLLFLAWFDRFRYALTFFASAGLFPVLGTLFLLLRKECLRSFFSASLWSFDFKADLLHIFFFR
jgi:hypothetical protein